ncbi:MAG: (d)CMP kinase [Alphaproteobacteria bacterium]|nr:(d)CMP kinase [Alphaproteobacteria bacterium]
MVIAIDGPSASGKGTLARRLAEALDLAHLDTGALYRAVGWKMLCEGVDPADEARAVAAAQALQPEDLHAPQLRTEAVGEAASKVAAIPAVREALVAFQRNFAATPPVGKKGAVLDGRDVGTVICPDAQIKLYVVADEAERAHRRALELRQRGAPADEQQILAQIHDRDARDRDRAVAPLKPAEDADLLDTTNLDIEAAFNRAIELVKARMGTESP